MSLTPDQTIQLWNAIGTWFAGLATFSAVVFSLVVLRRNEKVRLRVSVGLRLIISPGEPRQEAVVIAVTNLGERPVTITNISWRVGLAELRRYAVQLFPAYAAWKVPATLQHGQTAQFMVDLTDDWVVSMVNLGEGRKPKQWDTFRCFIHTSVGQDICCVPEKPFVQRIKDAQLQRGHH